MFVYAAKEERRVGTTIIHPCSCWSMYHEQPRQGPRRTGSRTTVPTIESVPLHTLVARVRLAAYSGSQRVEPANAVNLLAEREPVPRESRIGYARD